MRAALAGATRRTACRVAIAAAAAVCVRETQRALHGFGPRRGAWRGNGAGTLAAHASRVHLRIRHPLQEASDMTTPRFLAALLLAGASLHASAQEAGAPLAPPIHVAGGASDPAAVKRVQQYLAAPWKYKARRLSRADVDALLAKPDSVIFIDLRTPAEFIQYGSFPVFLSVQNEDLEKQLAWLPRDRQIVTVSNHAQRAGAAADLLASKGFNVAGATGSEEYEVEGGSAVAHLLPRAPRVGGAASQPRS
jgi:rhodanese-related sulfurtransferase